MYLLMNNLLFRSISINVFQPIHLIMSPIITRINLKEIIIPINVSSIRKASSILNLGGDMLTFKIPQEGRIITKEIISTTIIRTTDEMEMALILAFIPPGGIMKKAPLKVCNLTKHKGTKIKSPDMIFMRIIHLRFTASNLLQIPRITLRHPHSLTLKSLLMT